MDLKYWGFKMSCESVGQPVKPETKKGRVRCPDCGRRIFARRIEEDGHEYFILPPHNKKGWYKRPKKQSKDMGWRKGNGKRT